MGEETVDLRAILILLWAKRWWIAATTIVFALAGAAWVSFSTPIYLSSTVLISASPDRNNLSGTISSALGQLGGLASLAGGSLGGSDTSSAEALAVLQSRQFTEKFISDFNLMPVLFYRKWDSIRGHWKGDPKRWPTPAKAVKYFIKDVEAIVPDKKSGLTILQIRWKDRQVAADWANELVKRLNLEMRHREIEKADASVSYLEKELTTTQVVETRDAINRLIESQVKQRMLANVTQEYAFRVVDTATAPDPDDPVKPQKLLLYFGSPLLGFFLSSVAVLGLAFYWRGI